MELDTIRKQYLLLIILPIWVLCSASGLSFAQEDTGLALPDEPRTTDVALPSEETPAIISTQKIIKAFEVRGNKTITMPTILSRIKSRVGQPYYQNVISDDLKRLYNTGYFADVSVDRQEHEGGYKVIIYLEEKPIVEKITFSRTREIKRRTLLSKMRTKEGKFLNNKTLKDDVNTIKELYATKGLTQIDVEVEKDIDDITNKARIHFIVKEGQRFKIKELSVYGNRAFGQRRIIRVMKTRADGLFTSGYLKEEVLNEDMERIRSFYEQNGFIDVEVNNAIDYLSDGRINVKVTVNEGKQYFIDSVMLTGNSVMSDEDIRAIMSEVLPGATFSRNRLTVDLSNIRTLYFDKGYIFANVQESTSLNSETGKVNVSLEIIEGDVAYVNRINVQGNTRTRDIVVRRELRLHPGDRFDGEKLRRSKERLRSLGYFEDVSYSIEDSQDPKKKDLVVQVKETKTGALSFGGGFSTVDKLVGFVEIEQRNFDITNWPTFTGGGQQLTLRAESGSTRNNLRLSFTEPWIFDYPVSGGFDAFRTGRERDEDVGYAYDEDRTGGNIRLGKQFSEHFSGNYLYRFEEIEIGNFEEDVSAALRDEEGTSRVGLMGLSPMYDRRNSTINPTTGFLVGGSADIAGKFFGGTEEFYRVQTKASYYVPLKFDSVVEFRFQAGVIDTFGNAEEVPIFERFFAGGARTIRGYEERKVGPLDTVSTDDPVGGEALLVGNIEYTFPVIEFLKLAAFYDIGNVWEKMEDFGSGGYKAGAGLGLRIKTPIGPVSLDYGYPLNDEPGEEDRSGKFYFSVSRGF